MPGVEMREQRRRQVAAGGGADDAHARRVESFGAGAGAQGAQRAGGVVQHRRVAVAGGAKAVFEDVGGDAARGEPLRVTLALGFREVAVAAAGQDEHGGAVGRARGGRVAGERGRVLRLRAQGAGRAGGP